MGTATSTVGGSLGSILQNKTIRDILIGAVIMYLILQVGSLLLIGIDPTVSAIIVSVVMLAAALVLERVMFQRDLMPAVRRLGYGKPGWRAIIVAVIISLGMLAFFPIYSAITGVPIGLQQNWLWILLGAIVLNGLAEETLFRSFVFGHLRQDAGMPFRRAGIISLVIFAAVHLYLFIQNPFAIAFIATLLAIVAAFPMAFLFERGNNTIWACVILHVTTHSIRFVAIEESAYMSAVVVWLLFQLAAPLVVFAFVRFLSPSQAE
jgi:membrane protease YdiL (CAAX protease family)